MLLRIIACLLIAYHCEVVKGKPQTSYPDIGFTFSNSNWNNTHKTRNNHTHQHGTNNHRQVTTTTKPLYPTLYPRFQPPTIPSGYEPSAPLLPFDQQSQHTNFSSKYPHHPHNTHNFKNNSSNFNGTNYNRDQFWTKKPPTQPTTQPTTTRPYFNTQPPIIVKGPQTSYPMIGFNFSNPYRDSNNKNGNNYSHQYDSSYNRQGGGYNEATTTTRKPLYPTLYPPFQPPTIPSRYEPSAPFLPYDQQQTNNFNGMNYNLNQHRTERPPIQPATIKPYFNTQPSTTGIFDRLSQFFATVPTTTSSYTKKNYTSVSNTNQNRQNSYNTSYTSTSYPIRGRTPPPPLLHQPNNNNNFNGQPLEPDYDVNGTPLAPFPNSQLNKLFNYENIHRRQPVNRIGSNSQFTYGNIPQVPLAPFPSHK